MAWILSWLAERWFDSPTERRIAMQPKLLRSITREEQETYERDGVVHLKNIIDPAWAQALAQNIDKEVARSDGLKLDLTGLSMTSSGDQQENLTSAEWSERQKAGEIVFADPRLIKGNVLEDSRVVVDDKARGHFISVNHTRKRNQFMDELVCRSPLVEVAAILTASKRVFFCDEQVIVKQPNTREKTSWHQDISYNHIDGGQGIAIRMPCDVETPEMGPVQYWRGSHRSRIVYKTNFFISDVASPLDEAEPIPQIAGNEADYDIVTYYPEPGDLVAHHLHTLHAAGGNASPTLTRRAITVRYAGDDYVFKWRPAAPPYEYGRVLRDGEPLDRAPHAFLQVWPAAGG
jgi:Phytanoyl-CoA dioxygenase (PhyH)